MFDSNEWSLFVRELHIEIFAILSKHVPVGVEYPDWIVTAEHLKFLQCLGEEQPMRVNHALIDVSELDEKTRER